MNSIRSGWISVSKREPCLICGKSDWCRRTRDGEMAHCKRIESAKPSKKEGWFHLLSDPLPVRYGSGPATIDVEAIDWPRRAEQMFCSIGAVDARDRLAGELGVAVDSLERLGVGLGFDSYSGKPFCSFPERDCCWLPVGIVRRFTDGEKKAMKGGHQGLYFEREWWTSRGPIFCPEGGSDTAALLTAELCVIGRPSNTGGIEKLIGILQGQSHRTVVILGENDERQSVRGSHPSCLADCAGCLRCWPGKVGAELTAARLTEATGRKVESRLIVGAKDARAFLVHNGFDAIDFVSSLSPRKSWLEAIDN